MIRAALFDLDGTLVDLPVPIEEVRAEIAALFAARGWSGAGPELRPILQTIAAVAAELTDSSGAAATLAREARSILDRAELAAAAIARRVAGADRLLERLAASHRLAIVTNNCAACARAALSDREIEVVIGRDEAAAKPDPAGLLAAIDQLGATEALWVGDAATDVAAGLAARRARADLSIEIVGLARGGSRAVETLRAAGADRVVESLAALAAS